MTDFPSRLDSLKVRLAQLDVPLRQVLLEARIIQVSLDDETKTGIDWSILQAKLNGTALHASFPILTNVENGIRAKHDLASQSYQVIAEALETFGKTNLLSSPRVMVADGQSARIHVGSQVPYVTVGCMPTGYGFGRRGLRSTLAWSAGIVSLGHPHPVRFFP